MTRYLTPSKIGLLGLAMLLTEKLIPDESIIPVISFIIYRVLPQLATDCDAHGTAEPAPLTMTMEDFDAALKPLESVMPGRSVMDQLLEKLWTMDNLHSMHEFFRLVNEIMPKRRRSSRQAEVEKEEEDSDRDFWIDRASPIGMFMRRCHVEFIRLQFDDIVKLWNAFIKFRDPFQPSWKRRSLSVSGPLSSIDSNLAEMKVFDNDSLAVVLYPSPSHINEDTLDLSREEIERLLEFQLERLQRYGDTLPDDVRETCQMMLKNSSGVPTLLHFVRFFDYWREGDYTMALENLHRYFDHTMFSHERIYYHYALLHSAILYADFGCFSEAIAAITETIATARENHDMSCLNFSLSWLYHLAKAYPRHMKFADYAGSLGTQKEALVYLKLKAKELRVPNLLSSTLLEEAKMAMATGEKVSIAFERMYQSAHVNTMYNIQHNFGAQILVQASIFGRLGLTQISDAYCNIILDCYSKCTPTEEILRASSRNAFSLFQAGMYKSAISLLESLEPLRKRNLRTHQYLVVSKGVMKLKRALRLHDLGSADLLLTQLLPSAKPVIDSELAFQIYLQKIDYLQRLGSFGEALGLIENLADKLKAEDSDIYQRIHVMILKALLLNRVGKPQKGFSVALRAADAAWKANLSPALWEAWGAVANILGELEEFEAEKQILDAVIPQAHGGGDVALVAQLYSWQADAHMGLAGTASDDNRLRLSYMSRADIHLDRALKYYKKVEDVRGECDTMHKKSMIASMRGDDVLADDWARRYITVYNAHMASSRSGEDELEDGTQEES